MAADLKKQTPSVKTVLGPVSPSQIGITSMHEHILWLCPGWQFAPEANENYPAAKVFELLYEQFNDFKSAEGKTLVDCTGIGLGRDIEFDVTLSRATGVNIVACTGFWAENKIVNYFALKDLDYHTELYIRELTQGMGTTNIQAGAIKVGNGRKGISPLEEMTYRAAARASKKTGALIITHGINSAIQHFEIMLNEGADPERIVISHCDAAYNLDLERDIKIAKKGAYVGYDHIGMEPEWCTQPYAMADERRVELCKAFIKAGYAKHLIIGCDASGYTIYENRKPGPTQHTFAHLLRKFVPKLKAAGVSEEIIHQILVETPRRALPF